VEDWVGLNWFEPQVEHPLAGTTIFELPVSICEGQYSEKRKKEKRKKKERKEKGKIEKKKRKEINKRKERERRWKTGWG
jgi:hypothetical protein